MCNSPFAVTNYGTKNLLGLLTARFEMLQVLLLAADAQDYTPDVQGKQGIEQDCQCGARDLPRGKGCLVGRAGAQFWAGIMPVQARMTLVAVAPVSSNVYFTVILAPLTAISKAFKYRSRIVCSVTYE